MDYTNRDRHRKRKKNKKQADELQMQWWRRRFDYIVLVRFSKLPSMTCKLHALLFRNIFVPFGFVEWNRLKWLKYFKYHDTNKTKRNTLLAFMEKKIAVPVLINSVTWCGIKASDKKKKNVSRRPMFHLLIIIWHLIKRNERNDEENEKKNPCLQHFCLMKLWLSFLLGTCEILDRLTSETVSLGKKNCRQPNKMKQSHNRKSEFQSKMNNRRWEHKWNSHSRHANMFIIGRNTHFYYWRIHFEIVKNHHFNSYKGEREKKEVTNRFVCKTKHSI